MKNLIYLTAILVVLIAGCEVQPYADFRVSSSSVMPGEVIQFTNLSDHAVSYDWDFGDGHYSNAANPTHAYTYEGIYTVALTAHAHDGKADMATYTIEVVVHPYADFTVDRLKAQPEEAFRFTNYSDNAVSYEWDFGDGYYSSEINPIHSYADEGNYTVTLTAYAQNGFSDVAYLTVDVQYTLLEVTVAEWNTSEVIEYIVPDALVILYETYSDWYNDLNSVVYGYTDSYGEVTFAGLDNRSYYVYAEASDVAEPGDWYDNLDFPDSYIHTQALIPFALNTFLCWVDYFPPNKDFAKSRRAKYSKDKIKSDKPSFVIVDVSK
jgi:chitodextrinase